MLIKKLVVLLNLILLCVTSAVFANQADSKKEKALPAGTPVLWQEPKDIASRDLYLGVGGEGLKPDLRNLTIVEEKESAKAVKLRVRDGSGREWMIKAGGETQMEVAACRIVWAAGYATEISYLVPRVEVEGKGVLENVRFEARSKAVKRFDPWKWDENPFVGTDQLQGLKVLLALLDNWNLRDENNLILFARSSEAEPGRLLYAIGDFDSPTDKTGSGPSLWHGAASPGQAAPPRFIDRVKGQFVEFNYAGRHKERLANITIAQARWIGRILSRLSDRQITDALRAGNYGDDQAAAITKIIRARISELVDLPGE